MRHPKRAITRDIRTRHPKRPQRPEAEAERLRWPETAIRVREVMSPAPTTVTMDASVGAAWKLMRDRRFRHLPVLDEDGRLVGIVTDRDLRQVVLDAALQEQLGRRLGSLERAPVRQVMTWGVLTTRPDADLRHAARVMREQRIGALPVTEGDRLVGILTETDVVRALERVLEEGVVSKTERWGLEA